MSEFLHALKTSMHANGMERLERFISYADAHPNSGLGQYLAAREAWLQRDLTTAQSFARRVLKNEPDAFEMLAICAEYHAERGEVAEAVILARQLVVSRRPDFARKLNRIVSAPLRFIASRRWRKIDNLYADDAAIYEQWQQWAQTYVDAHGQQ